MWPSSNLKGDSIIILSVSCSNKDKLNECHSGTGASHIGVWLKAMIDIFNPLSRK